MKLSNIFEQIENKSKSDDALVESLRTRYKSLQMLNESSLEYNHELETLEHDIFEAAMNASSFEESIAFVNRIDEGILSAIGNGIKGLFNKLKEAWNSLKGPIKNFLDTIEGSYTKYLDAGNLYESQTSEDFAELFEALDNISLNDLNDLKEYIFGTTHPIYSKLEPTYKIETLTAVVDAPVLKNILLGSKKFYLFLKSLNGEELKSFVEGIPSIITKERMQDAVGYNDLMEYVTKHPGKELPTNSAIKDVGTLKSFIKTLNQSVAMPTDSETTDSDNTADENKDSDTRQKAVTVVIKKILSDKKFNAVYEKTGTSKKDVWVSKGGFYERLKLNDFKVVKTIIGMKKKLNTSNAAYVTFFAFIPVLWEEFMNTSYAKGDQNFYNYLKFNMTAVRKLEAGISTTDLALDGFDKEFNTDLQSNSKYATLTNDQSLKNTLGTDAYSKPKVKTQIMEALKKYNKNDFDKNLAMLQVLEKSKILFLTFNSKITEFKVQSTLRDDEAVELLISQLLQDSTKLEKFVSLSAFPKYDKAIYPNTEDYVAAVISLL